MGKHSETIHKINRSKSDTEEKQRKRTIRWGIKSCLSILLAATVTTTTIYSQVLYAQAETGETSDGKISFTFQPLDKTEYKVDIKGTKDQTLEKLYEQGLPKTLTVTTRSEAAIAEPVIPDVPEEGTADVSGNTPDIDVTDIDASEKTDGTETQDTENKPGFETEGTDTSGKTDGSEVQDTENKPGSGTEGTDTSGKADGSDVQDSEKTQGSDTADTDNNTDGSNGQSSGNTENSDDSNAADTDSSEDSIAAMSVTVPDTLVISEPEEASVEIMTLENNADSDVTNNNPGDNTNQDEPAGSRSFELPIETWDCDHYDAIRDFYIFTPKWDETAYEHEGGDIPTITVTFSEILDIEVVSSEEQLREAFQIENLLQNLPEDKSEYRIVLGAHIALTGTLNVPALPDGAKVTLQSNVGEDGKVYSLTRGSTDSVPFTGAMLNVGTSEVAQAAGDVAMPFAAGQNAGGTLTLRDITIDGKKTADISDPSSDANQVYAPAVISSGHLILGKGASIINNYNAGTYQLDENGANICVVPPCGGGIWVCGGALELQKGCRISNNCAKFGGGVYLDSGALLKYYAEAEALTGNKVSPDGPGADLYACAGSTIYYDPVLFVKWSTFYIDPDAKLIQDSYALDKDTPIEIYLNVRENSGYSLHEVKEKLESSFGDRVTVLLPHQTYIDTTDLRDWYVYDHYDMDCWTTTDTDGNGIPDSWEEAYREYLHRPYFVYRSTNISSTIKSNDIPTWLKETASTPPGSLMLAPFKEHIYSRTENGRPEMTFAGYDVAANVDFLFYDPESSGQKIVEFDVDSSKVNTHTLTATGFLVNTGIKGSGAGELMSGYLIYYTYLGQTANYVNFIKFEDINVNSLHNGGGIYALTANSKTKVIGSEQIRNWKPEMSIKITVDPDQVTLQQWPKNNMDSSAAESFTWSLSGNAGGNTGEDVSGNNIGEVTGGDTGYNGFGPLVAYNSHNCGLASRFTYSNLRMRFSNPADEKDLLTQLMDADFSQQGNVKKYYLNLLGESGTEYNPTVQMGQYAEFLYLMQNEGVGLITDANTPFEEYLGDNGSQNLYEISSLVGTADLNALVTSLESYVWRHSTTDMSGKLAGNEVKKAEPDPDTPIGNTWLRDVNNGTQIRRTLDGNQLPEYYWVEIMDISCNHNDNVNIRYSLLKPGSSVYEPLLSGSDENSGEDAVAFYSDRGATGVYFVITHDENKWPAGEYTVRQQIGNSRIYGYSYFTLTRSPIDPTVIPPAVNTSSTSGSHSSEPVLAAPEITAPDVVQPTVTSDGASQPKTGDGMFPAMPVACGACTAFMMKIMLWMYDVDFDIITEHKEELVRSLILWGKGSARPRIYMAIVALTAVITAYHLLKAFVANSKQIVRERLGI